MKPLPFLVSFCDITLKSDVWSWDNSVSNTLDAESYIDPVSVAGQQSKRLLTERELGAVCFSNSVPLTFIKNEQIIIKAQLQGF